MLDKEAKEAYRLYKRDWNRKNKDKVKASQEKYWKKRAEAMKNKTAEA